jgi:hypothetical protein
MAVNCGKAKFMPKKKPVAVRATGFFNSSCKAVLIY